VTPRPTVSVCIPAYRSERFIGEAVGSVIGQTFPDWELVIVDDASPDRTQAVIESFADDRIRAFRNDENLGATANWNRAVGLARGRFVKILCGDDVLAPDCLREQVAAFDRHPEVALVAGRRDIVDEDGHVLIAGRGLGRLRGVVTGAEALRATVRSGTNIFGEPAAVLLRADLVAACGPFSGDRPYVIDLDYWCRVLGHGPLYALDTTVATFRVSLSSWSVELARHQAAQTVDLFAELRRRHSEAVSAGDVTIGTTRARVLALARAATYRTLRAGRDGAGFRTGRLRPIAAP
jgi:glycosyltransferase involved in cell wall biosynthesis